MGWRACTLLGVIAVTAQGQQAPLNDKANWAQTVDWLRSAIAQGGYVYTRGVAVMRDRLHYRMQDAGRCHISWRPEASGDEEMLMVHPQDGLDQEFSVIEPHSAQVTAVDLAKLEDNTEIKPEKTGYWQVTARWAYVANDGSAEPDEPFGFVFSDERLADETAVALNHAIELCSGPQNDVGVGCKTVNEKIEIHVSMAGPTFINHSDYPITCVTRA